MTSSAFGGIKGVSRSLLSGLFVIFRSHEFNSEHQISALDIESYPNRVLEGGTTSLQKVVHVSETTVESRRARKPPAIFATTYYRLHGEARTKQICPAVKASMAVEITAASDFLMAHRFLIPFREKAFSPFFLSGSALLRNVLSRKKAASKATLLQTVPENHKSVGYFIRIRLCRQLRSRSQFPWKIANSTVNGSVTFFASPQALERLSRSSFA